MPESTEKQAKEIPVVWVTTQAVADRLLGKAGREVLDGIIALAKKVAVERDWPMTKIKIGYHQDMEYEDWEEIVVIPVFKTDSWAEADSYKSRFMADLNGFRDGLNVRQRAKFIKAISYGRERE